MYLLTTLLLLLLLLFYTQQRSEYMNLETKKKVNDHTADNRTGTVFIILTTLLTNRVLRRDLQRLRLQSQKCLH